MLGCTCASHRSTQSSGKQGHGLLQACCSLSALAGPAARTTSVKDWHLSSPIGMVPAAGTSPTNAAGFDAASLHLPPGRLTAQIRRRFGLHFCGNYSIG